MNTLLLCETHLAGRRYAEEVMKGTTSVLHKIRGTLTHVNGDVDYFHSSKSSPESLLGGRWQSFAVLYPDEWTPSKELLELVERRIRPEQGK